MDAVAPLQSLLESLQARLEAVESQLGIAPSTTTTSSQPKAKAVELPKSIKAYDEYCDQFLRPFVETCNKLGGDCAALGTIVSNAWKCQRDYLLLASNCKKPSPDGLATLFNPIKDSLQAAQKAIGRNEWEKHQKTVAGGLGCLNWVNIERAPRDFIENFVGESDFHANKIRVEFKKSNPDQIDFCNHFKNLIIELMAYVKEYHTTGVAWNAKGVEVGSYSVSETAPQAENKPVEVSNESKSDEKVADKAALFSSLQLGGAITSGLKKVTNDQKTYKAEYKPDDSKPVVQKSVAVPRPQAGPSVKGPPICEFREAGLKWAIENQTSAQGVVNVEIKSVKHMVYIFGCDGATIDIRGKGNSVSIDNCKNTKVLFDSMISSCEMVNCKKLQIQVRTSVPSVAIDKTDGVLVYLSRESLATKFVTSKSSEMNVSFPNENDDMIEVVIPEQFQHSLILSSNPKMSSEVSDLYT